ncbi:acyl-CoA synthase [Corynebacterium ulcerans]|uniref:Long-chain-fatty-acid--AMP ligase FadD32 n=1 Tax=Corynebacterium ulcerans TaxID=65058 RepID=A0ABD7MV71_CORUL|nr:FadD32-like long-chain-fatty-acid--AMP ligase [Corynebacterium ulcerans]AIT90074.1 Long-chain-fatty-acid--AMP ligase FadD32 [Corynebacterium ulcerans]ALD95873.1 Long-chain-fatty-acid--AMP ligase FadD32 [Corynebacterium ulcerans]MBH5298923.1 AMP-binding protein [Corynebacterium ulcerans]PLV98500.1 acyl-CoA synthase [Corynebacterium ulcerans]PME06799.1 acyl-CoA synthase [Corynebacterium ulcerans]
MDLNQAMRQFFDEKGEINLRPELTLAGLGEVLFQADAAMGGADRHCIRFWDFSSSREGEARDFNRTEVNTRIKVVAARLQQVGSIGDRVAILANNSPEYLFGFLGSLYAGMVPVPLYDPTEPGHADHLTAVMGDAKPTIVLTNNTSATAVRRFFAEIPGAERPRIISIDSLPDSGAQSFVNPLLTEEGQAFAAALKTAPVDLPAFLQYTSGSTRTPAGVMLTNRSILTNVLQIFTAIQLKTPLRLVSWLPLHHDMGIILAAFVTLLGLEFELMAPRDFIQQPSRWVNQLKRREGDNAVYTVVPNFALELAARYAAPEAGSDADFSKVDGLIVGSEPVTEKAVNAFVEAFGPFGLNRSAIRPSYGLAEASLLVTTPQTPERPSIAYFDRDELAANKAVRVDSDSPAAVSMMGCGQAVAPQKLVIVDPETKQELADGSIGEIWVHGDNVAAGYLDRDADTAETFRNTLAGRLAENSRAEGAPEDDRWMATGDLGTMVDGDLFITGRLKDLVIIAGRNHYPQDIEYTVDHASEHIRPAAVAAFAIEGDDVEKLIILAERDLERDASGDAEAIEAIRAAVTESHGVVPTDIRVVAPGEILRSSSGKIARRVNKKAYLEQ